MEEKTNDIANQTEIPVNDLPKTKSKLNLPKIDKKILIGLGILIAVFVLGISLAIFSNKPSKTSVVVSKEYELAYNAGDYKKAEQIAKQELAKDKSNPQVNAGVINAISSQGNQTGEEKEALEQSKPYIDQAIKTGSQDLEVLLSVGYAYEAAGDYEKALEYYKKATELAPNSSAAWFHYGHALQFLNKSEQSQEAYSKSFTLNPTFPLGLIGQANEYFSVGKIDEAKKTYLEAAERPDADSYIKADALTSASTISRYQGNLPEALEFAKKALEISPNYSPALGQYGYLLAMTGDNEEGIKQLKKSIEANPRITKNKYMLGNVLRANKDYIGAINSQKEAISGVDDDNTLVGTTSKGAWKGTYTYELAKTYYMANINTDIIPLLKEAILLKSANKSILVSDMQKYSHFKNLESNPEFQLLIN